MELASKWDSLTSVQQRYIATQAAGSRQQSRFIALMQDYARTQELVNKAYNEAYLYIPIMIISIYYANMSTSNIKMTANTDHYLKAEVNGTEYSVYDDSGQEYTSNNN